MTTPHKHKELIHAWADGAIIQFKHFTGQWRDCENNKPEWIYNLTYRVKPEPEPDYSKYIGIFEHSIDSTCHHTDGVYSSLKCVPKEFESASSSWYSLISKLELIFDGETKELKDVKIHGKE